MGNKEEEIDVFKYVAVSFGIGVLVGFTIWIAVVQFSTGGGYLGPGHTSSICQEITGTDMVKGKIENGKFTCIKVDPPQVKLEKEEGILWQSGEK